MATAYKILLSPDHPGVYVKGDADACRVTSELLQENLDKWHILFSEHPHRHNHIVHCLLSLYGFGASADEIRLNYEREKSYQMRTHPVIENDVEAMKDKEMFKTFLDKPSTYSSYLAFFQREIEVNGVKSTLEKHLFARDEHGKRMWGRFFASLFHPVLHLGYAFEFRQPALVAESLAMAAMHEPIPQFVCRFMEAVEAAAGGIGKPGKKTLRGLYQEIRASQEILEAADGDIPDGGYNVANNNLDAIVKLASQYTISRDQLDERFAEMVDTVCCSISNPVGAPAPYKVDFWLLHSVNLLVMMPAFFDHQWIDPENSIRLFEGIGRINMLTYAGQKCPEITSKHITSAEVEWTWEEIIKRATYHPTDDGHLQKCIRTLVWAHHAQPKALHKDGLLIKDDQWLNLANMVTRSVRYHAKTTLDRWLFIIPH